MKQQIIPCPIEIIIPETPPFFEPRRGQPVSMNMEQLCSIINGTIMLTQGEARNAVIALAVLVGMEVRK